MNSLEKKRLFDKSLPILAKWMCGNTDDFYKIGLYLDIPYHKLIEWEKENTCMKRKCLNILEEVYSHHGEDFPNLFVLIVKQLQSQESFDFFLNKEVELKNLFESYRFVHKGVFDESELMKLLFEMCECSKESLGFDILLACHMGLSRDGVDYNPNCVSVYLFKLFIKGYVKFPLAIFVDKCCKLFSDAYLDVEFRRLFEKFIFSLELSLMFDFN